VPELDVAPADEFPPGSHDDGPLCEGDWDEETCTVVCPRHGSQFELSTGTPRSLPATEPVATYPVRVADGMVRVDIS